MPKVSKTSKTVLKKTKKQKSTEPVSHFNTRFFFDLAGLPFLTTEKQFDEFARIIQVALNKAKRQLGSKTADYLISRAPKQKLKRGKLEGGFHIEFTLPDMPLTKAQDLLLEALPHLHNKLVKSGYTPNFLWPEIVLHLDTAYGFGTLTFDE